MRADFKTKIYEINATSRQPIETNDYFGSRVAVSSDTVVVGAYREASNQVTITNGTTASANNSATLAGAAYVFKR